jgi:hypothetical protein
LFERGQQFRPGRTGGRISGDHDVSAASKHCAAAAEIIANTAFDAVAANRVAIDLARNRQPKPGRLVIGKIMHSQQRRAEASAVFKDAAEFGFCANPRLRRKRRAALASATFNGTALRGMNLADVDLAGHKATGQRPDNSADPPTRSGTEIRR